MRIWFEDCENSNGKIFFISKYVFLKGNVRNLRSVNIIKLLIIVIEKPYFEVLIKIYLLQSSLTTISNQVDLHRDKSSLPIKLSSRTHRPNFRTEFLTNISEHCNCLNII